MVTHVLAQNLFVEKLSYIQGNVFSEDSEAVLGSTKTKCGANPNESCENDLLEQLFLHFVLISLGIQRLEKYVEQLGEDDTEYRLRGASQCGTDQSKHYEDNGLVER